MQEFVTGEREALGLEVRAGMGEDVGGIAVHIAARISSEVGAGEVLTSSTVKDLVVGSGLSFLGAVVASSRVSRTSGGCSRPPESCRERLDSIGSQSWSVGE